MSPMNFFYSFDFTYSLAVLLIEITTQLSKNYFQLQLIKLIDNQLSKLTIE